MVDQRPRPIPAIRGYRDLTLIARGGFSSVYAARQELFDRTVAVKVLDTGVQDAEAQRRFVDECMLTGRLTGQPHIIAVFEAGVTEDNHPFLAMQYLPGGSLADRLAARGPLPVPEVVRIGTAVARALAAAHEAGILHRDIKPGNILLSADGQPVLSDFGIASRYHPEAAPASPASELAFTPAYSAPEVREGRPPTVASDLYSLGATLYTLLAGTSPLRTAADPAVLRARVRAGDFPDPDRGDLPPELMARIRRCLAYDPGRRPRGARQFADDLAAPFDRPTGHDTPSMPAREVPPMPGGLSRRGQRIAKITAAVVGTIAGLAAVGAATIMMAPKAHPVSSPPPAPPSTVPPSAAATASPTPTPHAHSPTAHAPPHAPASRPAVPPPATTSPPSPPPAPTIRFVKGSAVSLNSASGHGCKVWMNKRTPGPYFQGLVRSWGNDCDLTFYQSADDGQNFSVAAEKDHVVSAMVATGFYPSGNGRFSMVCLHDAADGKDACSQAFAG